MRSKVASAPEVPASILQQHEQCTLYLDKPASSLLRQALKR